MTGQGKSAIDTLLAESFKELALKHPIEKITIKEITDKAGVIRPTFYNHFQDKYDFGVDHRYTADRSGRAADTKRNGK